MTSRERIVVPASLRAMMVEVARDFRKTSTVSEGILWQALRGGQLHGLRFRRQHPIGPFVVDFYCPAANLVVEVDGPVHETQRDHDRARQELIEACGYRIARFTAREVESNRPMVVYKIEAHVEEISFNAHSPSPLEGEGARG